jgi:hypothetical protein
MDGSATVRESCAARPMLASRAGATLVFTTWAWPILSARALFDQLQDH